METLTLAEIQSQALKACNLLGIPRDLREDAAQEAWIAQAEGRDILQHLSSWWRQERKDAANVHVFSRPLPRDRAEMLEIRRAAESYK